jgi:mono/diheme cytochrome c family protein
MIRPGLRGLEAAVSGVMMLVLGGGEAVAQSVQRGMLFARANCARCHSIDKYSESPLKIAPPFRTLHLKYPVSELQEALAEGIVTGHQNMPEFRLDGGQIADFLAFLRSLE